MAVEAVLRGAPPAGESRWKLKHLRQCLVDWQHYSLAAVWSFVSRLDISWQHARQYVHSPDPDYAAKVDYLMETIAQAPAHEAVVLFADQLTYYNHASVSYDWAPHQQQPRSRTAYGAKRQRRIAGLLNIATGELLYLHRAKTQVHNLIALYEQAVAHYAGQQIYLIVDNWPVHYHPDILACLEAQRSPFERRVPASWKGLLPKDKYQKRSDKLPIQLLSLPTYASWLNPIEKVWRRLKDEVLHLHEQTDDFAALQERVIERLEAWGTGSQEMLSYCGLLAEQGLYSLARRRYLGEDDPK